MEKSIIGRRNELTKETGAWLAWLLNRSRNTIRPKSRSEDGRKLGLRSCCGTFDRTLKQATRKRPGDRGLGQRLEQAASGLEKQRVMRFEQEAI